MKFQGRLWNGQWERKAFQKIGWSIVEPVQRCKYKQFEVNVGVHQRSVLSPLLLFAIVIDVVMNEIKEGMLLEILYAYDVVLIAETMAEQQENYIIV